MHNAIYPVLGNQKCFPFYVSGIGKSDPEYHIIRENGLVSHQILFTESGEGIIKVDGNTYHASPGSVFYVASGVQHEYYPIDNNWNTCWVVFRGDEIDQLMKNLGFSRYLIKDIENIEEIQKIFDKIYNNYMDLMQEDENGSMLLYMYIISVRKSLLFRNEILTGNIVDSALTYLNHHYYEDVSLDNLANICHVSPQHVCRLFKERTGMRPMQYLAQKRINEAKRLLHGSKESIAEIGKKIGYKNPTYFGMVFKKYEGVTPSDFRRMDYFI